MLIHCYYSTTTAMLAAAATWMMILHQVRVVYAQDDGCDTIDTCVACLESTDCGFWQPVAGGSCASSCLIQDISCYSQSTFPDLNAEQTCQEVANSVADAQLCSSQTACGDCVGTVLSDGTKTCQWFGDEFGYCGSGCGMDGCGETTCLEVGDDDVDDDDCSTATTCTECLETDGCGFWQPAGGSNACASSCLIMDTACYNMRDSTTSTTIAEICQTATNNKADFALCSGKQTCGECVGTTLSDGSSTCKWFEQQQQGENSAATAYCASVCGMNGCDEIITCSSSPVGDVVNDPPATSPSSSCDTITTCTECLGSTECGFWQPAGGPDAACADSCLIADASCYSQATFPNLTVEQTCQEVVNDVADAELCASQTTCDDCVAATLSDGANSTCQWFAEFGYCASGCDMNGCGETTCGPPAADNGNNNPPGGDRTAPATSSATTSASLWTSGGAIFASLTFAGLIAHFA